MKISVLQENLAHGLSIVSRAVSPRSTLPVLSNILVATDEGRLRLSATNLELGITCWISAKICGGQAQSALVCRNQNIGKNWQCAAGRDCPGDDAQTMGKVFLQDRNLHNDFPVIMIPVGCYLVQ